MKWTAGAKTSSLLMAGALLILLISLLSLLYGTKSISYETVWNALFHPDPENIDHLIIRTSRIPGQWARC